MPGRFGGAWSLLGWYSCPVSSTAQITRDNMTPLQDDKAIPTLLGCPGQVTGNGLHFWTIVSDNLCLTTNYCHWHLGKDMKATGHSWQLGLSEKPLELLKDQCLNVQLEKKSLGPLASGKPSLSCTWSITYSKWDSLCFTPGSSQHHLLGHVTLRAGRQGITWGTSRTEYTKQKSRCQQR